MHYKRNDSVFVVEVGTYSSRPNAQRASISTKQKFLVHSGSFRFVPVRSGSFRFVPVRSGEFARRFWCHDPILNTEKS
jgi:hypothetical protein